MNNEPTKNPSRSKAWMPMLLIAFIAVAAGIFVGNFKTNGNAPAIPDQQDLSAIQSQLQSALVFPDDFKQVPDFSLLQDVDTPITEANLKGQWSVLFFGFTNCPDVCPITLAEMNGVIDQLLTDSIEAPQVLFVTVDPVRDPVEKMNEYVKYFNEDFIGVSGDLAKITALTSKLGIVASYTASSSGDGTYQVDHTASMLVIDPELRVRAKLTAPHLADTITADLQILLANFN